MARLAPDVPVGLPADRALVGAWANGDLDAGDAFVRRYVGLLWRFFRGKVDGDVADLVQRTLLSCVRNRDRLAEAGHVRAYVLATARHELYRAVRGRRGGSFDPLHSSLVADVTSPSRAAARSLGRARLRRALLELPVALAEAIELHYFEGLSGPELAEALGIPEGTVRSRLERARRGLADRLGPDVADVFDAG